MKVRVVAMRPGASAEAWDLTVGKEYEALPPEMGRGDFDYVDDAGERVWANLEGDIVAIWEVVKE